MQLNELRPNAGSTEKSWRKGRGHGSGNGKTAGKGHKGQNSRSGGGVRPGFEGGQMPLYRRLPKRGFKNRNRLDFVAINVQTLELFDNGAVVDAVALAQAGLVKNSRDGIVILGEGNLTKKLTVKAVRFSATAREKIEAAGGTVEVI